MATGCQAASWNLQARHPERPPLRLTIIPPDATLPTTSGSFLIMPGRRAATRAPRDAGPSASVGRSWNANRR